MKTSQYTFDDVQRLCEDAGLKLEERTEFHWQIIGGVKPVNLYWNRHRGLKVHMSGQTHSVFMPIPDAVAFAKEGMAGEKPDIAGTGDMRKKRRRLLKNDPHCRWCGCELNAETATVEHIVPRSQGGSNRADNLTLACEPCNRKRGGAAVVLNPVEHVERAEVVLL